MVAIITTKGEAYSYCWPETNKYILPEKAVDVYPSTHGQYILGESGTLYRENGPDGKEGKYKLIKTEVLVDGKVDPCIHAAYYKSGGAAAFSNTYSESGKFCVWGDIAKDRFGNGHHLSVNPTLQENYKVSSLKKDFGVQAIGAACGLHHTAAILDNGDVLTWGVNVEGQLGIGTPITMRYKGNHPSPTEMELPEGIFADVIMMGSNITVVKDKKGDIYRTGVRQYFYPEKVTLPKGEIALDIFGNIDSWGFLSQNGNVWIQGNLLFGHPTVEEWSKYRMRRVRPELFNGGKVIGLSAPEDFAAIVEF